jgi:hypothetical protein
LSAQLQICTGSERLLLFTLLKRVVIWHFKPSGLLSLFRVKSISGTVYFITIAWQRWTRANIHQQQIEDTKVMTTLELVLTNLTKTFILVGNIAAGLSRLWLKIHGNVKDLAILFYHHSS